MAEEEPQSNTQQPEAESAPAPAIPLQGLKKISPIYMKILAGSSWIWILIAFVVALAIVMAIVSRQLGDPTADTTAYASGVNCASWDDVVHPEQEMMIKDAAKKFNINPALLGAIFMAENGDRWPSTATEGPWATSSDSAMGPFQFIQKTWDGLLRSGGTPFKGYEIQNFQQAAEVAAFHIGGILDTHHWSRQSPTEQQVECMAAAYNKGGEACTYWKKNNFQGDPVPAVDADGDGRLYHIRTWEHYQDLNKGCTSYTSNKIVQLALKEAIPPYKPPSENCAKYNTVGNQCQHWCATFATTMYKNAGYNIAVMPSTLQIKRFFEETDNGHELIENPSIDQVNAGDIFFVASGASASGYHVGLVRYTEGRYVHTIEGNFGRGENDIVKLFKRNIDSILFLARW